jgi:hypothetical protein
MTHRGIAIDPVNREQAALRQQRQPAAVREQRPGQQRQVDRDEFVV